MVVKTGSILIGYIISGILSLFLGLLFGSFLMDWTNSSELSAIIAIIIFLIGTAIAAVFWLELWGKWKK